MKRMWLSFLFLLAIGCSTPADNDMQLMIMQEIELRFFQLQHVESPVNYEIIDTENWFIFIENEEERQQYIALVKELHEKDNT